MVRGIHRLSTKEVETAKPVPGHPNTYIPDGGSVGVRRLLGSSPLASRSPSPCCWRRPRPPVPSYHVTHCQQGVSSITGNVAFDCQ